MLTPMTAGKENRTLDVFKFAACIMIVMSHLPSVFSSSVWDFYFRQWSFRFCVPFFFISTGYFFYRSRNKGNTLKRIFWLYVLAYVLYLPSMLHLFMGWQDAVSRLRWYLLVGYEHLWYLNALLQGLLIWYLLEKIPVVSKLFHRFGVPASVALLVLGILLDEYYRILPIEMLYRAGEFLQAFGGPRNVVFMGFPLMMLGGAAARWEETFRKIPTAVLVLSWVVLRALGYWECTWLLQTLGDGITNDLTIFGCLPALALFLLSFRFQIPIPEAFAKLLRKMAEYIYVLHPLIAALISAHIYLYPEQPALLICTVSLCCALYILLEKQFVFKK